MKIIEAITNIETIAEGQGIRELGTIRQTYGEGNWKKKKGVAMVQLDNGHIAKAEIHWYKAHGIGMIKIKEKKWL